MANELAWGGHQNGRIPPGALTTIPWAAGHRLRSDAVAALVSLNEAYRARFGSNIAITDSYRDYDAQVRLKQQKPNLAATPGTSNHGWGLALDLGGGINSFGTAQHLWMRDNAPRYGWIHPAWAGQGGSKPEPWHWEYPQPYNPTPEEEDIVASIEDLRNVIRQEVPSTILGARLGSSGPTVGVALQTQIAKDAAVNTVGMRLGSSGPTVGVALQTGIVNSIVERLTPIIQQAVADASGTL